MGLPAALKAHSSHDYELAAKHYKRALDQGDHSAVLFQNYGSLLRSHGKNDQALLIYEQGLSIHPNHEGIKLNLANLLQIPSPWRSFNLHLSILKDHWDNELRSKHFLALVQILESQGCNLWAYQICKVAFDSVSVSASLLVMFYKLATSTEYNLLSEIERNDLTDLIENKLDDLSTLEKAEFYFTLSWVHVTRKEFAESRMLLDKARHSLLNSKLQSVEDCEKAQNLHNQNCWNMACTLLSFQQFKDGWSYFDYGLRTKAPGSQKWQRALPKPFTYDQIPLWRGENLGDKSLLLLEEQAIGDVMQFMSLMPTLLEEVRHIGILLCKRLEPIYRRSFKTYILAKRVSIWSFDDVLHSNLEPALYDYQSPIGSICRYRFTDISRFGRHSPILIADQNEAQKFRNKYLGINKKPQHLIGISWRGGGNSDRMKQKSIEITKFAELMSLAGVRFVSLQYGESASIVNKWRSEGLDVIHDSSVDSLKNMDRWLSQVAACDGVISVANTTIHGAGGLNIPTLCLLSLQSDWRWLKSDDVKRSYWYPSVGIARESKSLGWGPAFEFVSAWINQVFPNLQDL